MKLRVKIINQYVINLAAILNQLSDQDDLCLSRGPKETLLLANVTWENALYSANVFQLKLVYSKVMYNLHWLRGTPTREIFR